MRTICKVCQGKGTINNPKVSGWISYSGPNGESWPQTTCQNCGGTGWVGIPEGTTIPTKQSTNYT